MGPSPPKYWTPVRPGLVVDPKGKHIEQLGGGPVWLLLYCFLRADWRTGVVWLRTKTAAEAMHVPRRTVQRWLARLEEYGYLIRIEAGKVANFEIAKWKPIGRHVKNGALPRHS